MIYLKIRKKTILGLYFRYFCKRFSKYCPNTFGTNINIGNININYLFILFYKVFSYSFFRIKKFFFFGILKNFLVSQIEIFKLVNWKKMNFDFQSKMVGLKEKNQWILYALSLEHVKFFIKVFYKKNKTSIFNIIYNI